MRRLSGFLCSALVSTFCLILTGSAEDSYLGRTILAEILVPQRTDANESAAFDFQRNIVIRLSFQQSSAEDHTLRPYRVFSETQVLVRIQDEYPEFKRALYPDSLRRISDHEFYVTFPRRGDPLQDYETFCYLVVTDYADLSNLVIQVFGYRTVDLLR